MNLLTIKAGTASGNDIYDAKLLGSKIHLLGPENDNYTAFIRRTLLLRSLPAEGKTLIVDRHTDDMGPVYSRMLTRICAGLGADVSGAPWCGVQPEMFPQNFGPGCGNWQGKVLILAQSRSSVTMETGAQKNWPFISSNHSGVAAWLGRLLDEAQIPERQLYWMNVHEFVDGAWQEAFRHDVLYRSWPAVVTLGPDAANWARKNGLHIDHAGWHPGAWWRTMGTEPYPVIDFLREVLR